MAGFPSDPTATFSITIIAATVTGTPLNKDVKHSAAIYWTSKTTMNGCSLKVIFNLVQLFTVLLNSISLEWGTTYGTGIGSGRMGHLCISSGGPVVNLMGAIMKTVVQCTLMMVPMVTQLVPFIMGGSSVRGLWRHKVRKKEKSLSLCPSEK